MATAVCDVSRRVFWSSSQFSLQCLTKLLSRFSHTSTQWIVQRIPLTHQLISRAITVATYALSLECGHMLALPMWLRIISAYSVAALVPTLLPSAHGDNCRMSTTISASGLAAIRVSPTAALGVSFALCLCPTRMVWWRADEVIKSRRYCGRY